MPELRRSHWETDHRPKPSPGRWSAAGSVLGAYEPKPEQAADRKDDRQDSESDEYRDHELTGRTGLGGFGPLPGLG